MYGKTFQSLWRGSMRGKPMIQLVFIYMFCNCDQDGVYDCVPEDIADATGLDIKTVLDALIELESPDPDSRTEGNEGRRIIQLYPHRTWGWRIPNHAEYRKRGSEEHRKEKAAERQKRFRNASVTHSNASVTPAPVSVSTSVSASDSVSVSVSSLKVEDKEKSKSIPLPPLPQPQGEVAKAGGHPSKGKAGITKPKQALITVDDATFWAEMAKIYPWVDVAKEKAKMQGWLAVNPRRQFTRRFANGWLARIDKPLTFTQTSTPAQKSVTPEMMKRFLEQT